MSIGDGAGISELELDGQRWRCGTASDVAWIHDFTSKGLTIASAVPAVFAAYATVLVPDSPDAQGEQLDTLIDLLAGFSDPHAWWLAYLDTGADDVVSETAPRVTLNANWSYVLVRAGAAQARSWRRRADTRQGPDMIFHDDHAWLVSWLWDDQWRCIGGPETLVEQLHHSLRPGVRRVQPDEDATPPGHIAR